MKLIAHNSGITIDELSEKIGRSTRAIEMQLNSLKKQGTIVRIGSDKGGYWKVVKKPTPASPDGLD